MFRRRVDGSVLLKSRSRSRADFCRTSTSRWRSSLLLDVASSDELACSVLVTFRCWSSTVALRLSLLSETFGFSALGGP